MSVLATDNFNRADANPIGGNWTTASSMSAMQIVSNACQPSSLAVDCGAYYNAISWPNDQYSQCKVTVNSTGGGVGIGVICRQAAAANTCYRLVADHATTNNVELSKFVAGAFTNIWTRTQSFTDGDTLRLEVQGTTLRAFINSVQIGADATDSSIASGNAGVAYSAAASATTLVDDFEGGDFVSASIPRTLPRAFPFRDPGEAWWIQRDRRDANLVSTAANPLVAPLDTAWQADGYYWHLYNDEARYHQLVYGQQRDRESDPTLLTTALLEDPLLNREELDKRIFTPATHVPRWWMPQQPPRVADQSSPAGAPFDPLLAGWPERTLIYNTPAFYVDRREAGQQRPYISDPSFYPTVPPTDPLTLAWGVGGHYWLLYNQAALYVDRREVPQQRQYESDPNLLLTALLENELLGGADDLRRHYVTSVYIDRRETVPQRAYIDPSLLASLFDPTSVAAGVGGDIWRRYNTPAYADRRLVPQQPERETLYFDAGPGSPPLTLAWGAGGSYWHLYNRSPFWDRSWDPQQQPRFFMGFCVTIRPDGGITVRPVSGVTARPNTGITEDPC